MISLYHRVDQKDGYLSCRRCVCCVSDCRQRTPHLLNSRLISVFRRCSTGEAPSPESCTTARVFI